MLASLAKNYGDISFGMKLSAQLRPFGGRLTAEDVDLLAFQSMATLVLSSNIPQSLFLQSK